MKNAGLLVLIFICFGCNNLVGTLGVFQQWTFPVSEQRLDQEIVSFYKNYPAYNIPEKWKYLDNWEERGFRFLDGKIVYFANNPEEMYYVSYSQKDHEFDDDKNSFSTTIAVRAVNNSSDYGNGVAYEKWNTVDDFKEKKKEEDRINERFYNEVILKLEKHMNVKSKKYNPWYEFLTGK